MMDSPKGSYPQYLYYGHMEMIQSIQNYKDPKAHLLAVCRTTPTFCPFAYWALGPITRALRSENVGCWASLLNTYVVKEALTPGSDCFGNNPLAGHGLWLGQDTEDCKYRKASKPNSVSYQYKKETELLKFCILKNFPYMAINRSEFSKGRRKQKTQWLLVL